MPPKQSLEIRIDSIDDARSVVKNMKHISEKIKNLRLDSIEFLVAQEIKTEVSEIIYGIFRTVKTYTSYVSPREGNFLYSLPHFSSGSKLEISNPRVNKPVAVSLKNKGGRPKGSKNKDKNASVTATQ